MTKAEELRNPHGCLNKAAPDEPVFVLRAKDPIAAQVVRLWAAMAENDHSADKCIGALAIADQMDRWRDENMRAFPILDRA
jgi:hypothetical protein